MLGFFSPLIRESPELENLDQSGETLAGTTGIPALR